MLVRIPLSDPWTSFDRRLSAAEQLFSAMERGLRTPSRRAAAGWTEGEDAYHLEALLPGLAEEDLELTMDGDSLVLVAERRLAEAETDTLLRRERSSYRIDRRWTLPDDSDPSAVTAELRDGVLTLTLPKRPVRGPVKIRVRGAA